jgi:excisionase family DNA binding protein
MDKQALSINEAAQYSGIGRNTLRLLISWNKFPVIKIGNKVVIRRETLDRFLCINEGKNLRNKYEIIEV